MSGRSFVDTNVLVYAFDSSEPEKRQMALQALAESGDRSVLSTQVLSEFYVVTTSRLADPLPSRVAADVVDQLARLPIVETDTSLVRSAVDISVRSQISYWDGLIVAAAIASGCDRILTEDLSTGATINGVEIVNPFTVQRRIGHPSIKGLPLVAAHGVAMLRSAERLTRTPGAMESGDVDDLRAAGFTDRDVLDIVEVIASYAYANRIADGLGITLEPWTTDD